MKYAEFVRKYQAYCLGLSDRAEWKCGRISYCGYDFRVPDIYDPRSSVNTDFMVGTINTELHRLLRARTRNQPDRILHLARQLRAYCDAFGLPFPAERLKLSELLTQKELAKYATLRLEGTLPSLALEADGDMRDAVLAALYSEFDPKEFRVTVIGIVNGYCDELYRTLRDQYEYLTSDEAVIEAIEANGLAA